MKLRFTYDTAGQIVLAIFIDENNSILADSLRSIQSPTGIITSHHILKTHET